MKNLRLFIKIQTPDAVIERQVTSPETIVGSVSLIDADTVVTIYAKEVEAPQPTVVQ